jgi:3-hydroxybutyryl-CoA dehydrogenase
MDYNRTEILVIGNGALSFSVIMCLLLAGHPVTLVTESIDEAIAGIDAHILNTSKSSLRVIDKQLLKVVNIADEKKDFQIAIAITDENFKIKQSVICKLEKMICKDSIIAINTESIPISDLQYESQVPNRIIGLNWTEPAHTSFFLEIIINGVTNKELAIDVYDLAKKYWSKHPYLITTDLGIRAKLLSVMAREAFHLVDSGYASIEDIDRACRNDAGYYLPFSGNFRYMDLMGTYAYGLVMKDLNRELSCETKTPDFFNQIIEQGGLGMENKQGFYNYEEEDVKRWKEVFSKFCYQIHDVIGKYPFNYTKHKNDLING